MLLIINDDDDDEEGEKNLANIVKMSLLAFLNLKIIMFETFAYLFVKSCKDY